MSLQVRIHRIRVVVKMTQHTELHASHSATVYALLCEANARGFQIDPAIPDGLLLDAVEQCRVHLAPGQHYAFGFTLMTASEQETAGRIKALIKGLYSVASSATRGVKLGGNFRIDRITDLVSGRVLTESNPAAQPIASSRFVYEWNQLKGCESITLRFTSPVRAQRPATFRTDGHYYMDGQWFDASLLAKRMLVRQRQTGFLPFKDNACDDTFGQKTKDEFINCRSDAELELPSDSLHVSDNRLAWLDVTWGRYKEKKSLGGCYGRLTLKVANAAVLPVLVAGQYLGVGANTAFGFGRFRIEELGEDPTACHRAVGLTELAFRHPAADNVAARYQLESGLISRRMNQIQTGSYEPDRHQLIRIQQGEKERLLNVPSRLDRGLQRCVIDLIDPAIDKFLESSAVAYRRGLNRESAAKRLREAWNDGYRWALKADFHRFFDSVSHDLLEDRIDAYINDNALCSLIMKWVRAGAPEPNRGLPTGAVLSPLLANLFLDKFDEQVEVEGRRLIRYADDLMLLFQSSEDAESVFQDAERAANELSFQFNEQKTQLLNLNQPFNFLGFRFDAQHQWTGLPTGHPVRVDELGWEDARPSGTPSETIDLLLPGEKTAAVTSQKSVIILGPGLAKLDVDRERLSWKFWSSSQAITGRSIDRIRSLVVLGYPTLSHRFVKACAKNNVMTTLVNRNGRSRAVLSSHTHQSQAATVKRQCAAAESEEQQLHIARRLISAKISNFATLAAVSATVAADSTESHLRRLEERLDQQETVQQLLGIEGAAAARWYSDLNSRLGKSFRLERRVSPKASDPVNVMLNIAHTSLYRICTTMLQHEGFCPSVGIMHQPRSSHMALASDLQEPFRHLMERAVIEATHQLNPSDFVKSSTGPFRLIIRPHAIRRLMAIIHRALATPVQISDTDAVDYYIQIQRTARSLDRYLAGRDLEFSPFQHESTKL